MGQKVHPYGFRLGVVKTWKSKWYEDKNYATWLHEDLKLKKRILKEFVNAGIADIEIERAATCVASDSELAGRFAHHLKGAIGVSAVVKILPADTLPRATHKARRVEDRRSGVWG